MDQQSEMGGIVGLAESRATEISKTFKPLWHLAQQLVAEAAPINVTDATQVTEIKRARAARLKLRQVRIDAEKARKAFKVDINREGRAIDEVYRNIEQIIEPTETRLQEMEDFAERAEAARLDAIAVERADLLRPYANPDYYNLRGMPPEQFAQLLDTQRVAHQARIDAAAKAKADAEAAEAARLERERVTREENERLRKEAEEREAAAKAERDRLEAIAEEERRKAREAEAAAAKERAAAEEAAAAAKRAADAAAKKARDDAAAAQRKHDAEVAEATRKAEEKIRIEREARERAEAEADALQRQRAAEAKARADAEKAEADRKARAPDAEKLREVAAMVREILDVLPDMATEPGKLALADASTIITKAATYIENVAGKLA